jgi:hypothetical protein
MFSQSKPVFIDGRQYTAEEKCLRTIYARYVLENHKMRMVSTKIGWPLSFDEWWRAKADDLKDNRDGK